MKRFFISAWCGALLASALAIDVHAQAAETHVAAAKALAAPKTKNYNILKGRDDYRNYQNVVDQFCTPPKLPDTVRQEDRSKAPPLKDWYAPPAIIFDNFYFIGSKGAGVFAVNTSEGIFLIDTNFDWDIQELVQGLLNFGLDPENIKYILITHAHDDRYWGAKTLQDMLPKAHVVMGAADWDLIAKNNDPARVKPKRDIAATDGQKFTMGGTTVTVYVTPGHTPGALSMIIAPLWNKLSVHPDNDPHVATIWAGADINIGRQGVQYFADGKTMMQTYVSSLKRFIDIGNKAGADVLISTNNRHANTFEKIRTWRIMNPDESGGGNADGILADVMKVEHDPHPFVGKDDVSRFYGILLECYEAQLAWREKN